MILIQNNLGKYQFELLVCAMFWANISAYEEVLCGKPKKAKREFTATAIVNNLGTAPRE